MTTIAYISKLFDLPEHDCIYPLTRRDYTLSTSNARLRSQRYTTWRLLEEIIERHTAFNFRQISFRHSDGGQWLSPDLYFSLTHTGHYAAAIVSDAPVGIDMEECADFYHRFSTEGKENAFFKRITTLSEQTRLLPKDSLLLWTQKESIFKMGNAPLFRPNRLETAEYDVSTYQNGELCISICTQNSEDSSLFFF